LQAFQMESLDLQALSIDSTEHAAYLFKLLSCCSKELGVQDLARIAASSKSLKEACIAIAKRYMLQLLGAAVAQGAEAEAQCSAAEAAAMAAVRALDRTGLNSNASAASVANTVHKMQLHAVAWLLRAAPVEAASAAAVECVLRMPAVPQQAAVQLVTAGVRVTFAQLLSAANSMVKGVEVWVLAQQQLGGQTDIPRDAVDICMDSVSVFKHWVSRSDWANNLVHGVR
jgi:hypothetical protein